tara:strand:+ start:11092 stop:11847 length:756 start_codon:yes stop_codon:yes gene_type:complete
MPGTPPSKSWLNRDWREYLLEIAEDVKSLQQYVPMFEQSVRDVMGGDPDSVSTSRSFPALITENSGFSPNGCNYTCRELYRPRTVINETTGEIEENAAFGGYFLASNVYEEGLVCGSSEDKDTGPTIPPSLAPDNFCFREFSCSKKPIGEGISPGVVVIMHAAVCNATNPDDDDDDDDGPLDCGACLNVDRVLGESVFYYFAAVVQPCLTCAEDDEGFAQQSDSETIGPDLGNNLGGGIASGSSGRGRFGY